MHRNTKRAMLLSLCSILICISMLIGSTFAWFTDTKSTAVNQVQAGTLTIDLQDAAGSSVVGQTLNFKKAPGHEGETLLWEPGCTYELDQFKVVNTGNLAIKYKVVVTGIGDAAARLNEAIEWTYNGQPALAAEFTLLPGAASDLIGLQGHMKETAGNEYQGLAIDGAAITVLATQDTVEFDSTTDQYDQNASLNFMGVVDETTFNQAVDGKIEANLLNDVALTSAPTLTNAVINANGFQLSGGNATRTLNITGGSPTEPVDVTINGAVMDRATGSYHYNDKTLSIYGGSGEDISVKVNHSLLTSDCYTVRVGTGAVGTVNLDMTGTEIHGWAAVQTNVPTTANFTNCKFVGVSDHSGPTDEYAVIAGDYGTGSSVFHFTNCIFDLTQTGTAKYSFFQVNDPNDAAAATFTGCTFIYNGTTLTSEAEIMAHMEITGNARVTLQ